MKYTEQQLKGVNLATKALSKKYKFIDGWQTMDDYEKYDVVLFIDLIVNPIKFIEYYGVDEKNINKERLFNKFKVGILFSLTQYSSSFSNTEEQSLWDEKFHFFYNEKVEMEKKINIAYRSLPENMQLFTKYGTVMDISLSSFVSA